MNLNLKSFFLFLAIAAMGVSCRKNNTNPNNNNTVFQKGVFVVDEGNYSDADGEVTFINFITGDVRHNVYHNANGRPFGGVLQSMSLYQGKAYLVDQLGRLEAVNATDFKSDGTLSKGLAIPRYFAALDTKGYITDWGPYDADYNNTHSKIVEVDLGTLQITDSVSTLSRPEGILVSGNHIFVANSATDKVTVYAPVSLTKENEITVNYRPVQLAVDKYGYVWVACTGTDSTRSTLEKIDPSGMTDVETITLPDGITLNGKLVINGTKDVLYLMSQQWAADNSYSINNVFAQPVDRGTFSYSSVLSRRNLNGLGVDPDNYDIYVSDAEGFQTNGMIYAYNVSGLLLDSAQVDIGPRDFCFLYP